MREIGALSEVFGRRWALPVLAMLFTRRGEKFVTMMRTLGTSQGGLKAALDKLISMGLVRRNPGYGHPMRPEYVLVPGWGMTVGERAQELRAALVRNNAEETAGSKWALPVVLALSAGDLRFNDLAAGIEGATDRVLVLSLKSLVERGLVERAVSETYPPSVRYSLTESGRLLVPEVEAFAKSLVE